MQPCAHAAVWKATELETRPDWLRTWSDEERSELDRLARTLPARIEAETLERLGPISAREAPRLHAKLVSIRHDLEHGCGATRIRGFPLDELGEERASAIFWRLMDTVGTPLAQTASGQRLFRVQDEGHAPDHPQSRGPSSAKGLSFHTDRCDILTFLCVRQAPEGGENQLVSSMAVYNHILSQRPDLLLCLMEPYTYQRHNVDPANKNAFYQQPVFSFCDGHFAANVLRVLIERAYATPEIGPMPDEMREALDYFEAVAEQLHVTFRQEPGDIVLLNNYVTLHRRSAFRDGAASDQRRLLFRIWLAVPNSRPLDPSFAASYGATGAGQIRGGMRQATT